MEREREKIDRVCHREISRKGKVRHRPSMYILHYNTKNGVKLMINKSMAPRNTHYKTKTR